MTTYTITITDDYTVPEGPMADNQAYLTFVMNKAAESYRNQYAAADFEAGITAAREAYNAALPAPVETSDAA
jgi:hypothetical protein